MIASLIFYLFAGVLVASAIGVVALNNPVHSVLFLILSFFNASALFLLIGAEYLGLILLIIYIGAVAVLFLFVVMMLDIEIIAAKGRDNGRSFFPVAMIIGSIVFIELLAVFAAWMAGPDADGGGRLHDLPGENVATMSAISSALYTDYIVLFQGSGLILLVAMIGAITLALRKRGDTRQQDIRDQTDRSADDSVDMVNIKPTGRPMIRWIWSISNQGKGFKPHDGSDDFLFTPAFPGWIAPFYYFIRNCVDHCHCRNFFKPEKYSGYYDGD